MHLWRNCITIYQNQATVALADRNGAHWGTLPSNATAHPNNRPECNTCVTFSMHWKVDNRKLHHEWVHCAQLDLHSDWFWLVPLPQTSLSIINMAARCNSVTTASTSRVQWYQIKANDVTYKFPGSKEKDCKTYLLPFWTSRTLLDGKIFLNLRKYRRKSKKHVSTRRSEKKTDCACAMTAGVIRGWESYRSKFLFDLRRRKPARWRNS